MRSKLSWITFIPLLLAACFLRMVTWLFPDGALFNLSKLTVDYIFLGAVVLVFLFTALFCMIDKRICVYYLPHRNIAACIIGILVACAFAVDGAISIVGIFGSQNIDVLKLIESILLLISAIVFLVLGFTHAIRRSEGKSLSLLNVFPALLCAVRMIIIFVSFTTSSLKLVDIVPFACYVFATLFFFNYAVALSHTKAKRAVKSCMIFGFPAVAALLPYGIFKLFSDVSTVEVVSANASSAFLPFDSIKLVWNFAFDTLLKNFSGIEAILIALYILSILIELTAFAKDKDSVRIIEADEEDEEEIIPEADAESDGFVIGSGNEDNYENDDMSYIRNTDTSDYLYQEVQNNDELNYYESAAKKDVDGYLTQIVEEEETESDGRPRDYVSRLDEIDKLILEISEKSD